MKKIFSLLSIFLLTSMLTLFYSFWIDSPDYTVKIVGSTIYAIPRSNTTLPLFVGTDAYTVIDSAVNRLTISGAGGSGGGEIDIMQGNYSLTNEITIIGWEGAGGRPHSYIKIKGVGYATKIIQNTSGKNAFVIKNDASVVMEDMYIFTGASAKSCIFGDSSGTSEISIWGGYLNNLFLESGSTSSPALYLKNFFDIEAPKLTISNTANWGTVLQNSSTTINYGNSHFGFLRSEGSASYPFGGLAIKSINSTKFINQLSVDNFECTFGYYGIATNYANYCSFTHIDIEGMTNAVALGALTTGSGNRTSDFSFHGGYILTGGSGDTAISVAVLSGGNTFDNVWIDGTSAVPIIDAGNFVAPNSYNINFGNSVNIGSISLANPQSLLTYRVNTSSIAVTKIAGSLTIPTPFTLGSTSVTTTGAQLNYLASATGTTGSTSSNLVFSTTPTFGTAITTPVVIGGTGTASTLTIRSTGGVGATGADIIFQTGNNGATEGMRLINAGKLGIGTPIPNAFLHVFSTVGNNAEFDRGTTSQYSEFIFGTNFTRDWTLGTRAGTSGLFFNSGTGGGTTVEYLDSNFHAGFGGNTSPTAKIHIAAGSATANTAPLKFTSGTNLTTAEAGAMEFDGTNFYLSPSTTRFTVALTGGSSALANSTTITCTPASTALNFTLTLSTNTTTTINMGTIPAAIVGSDIDIAITTTTTSDVITFGTNFKSQGTLTTGATASKIFHIKFHIVSTSEVDEISRTTAM